MLKLLDLFSGIGGFSLGLESTGGFETIGFVEKNKFCQKVLKKHWPNITIEEDIRNVRGQTYQADVITGGFPCQPFSVAGKRKGTDDDRYLWNETIRVIRECKPRWFVGENVEGLININNGMVLRQVQTDLEKEGFEVQCLVIPAAGIGAWHQRKRIWIMGYAKHNGRITTTIKEGHRKIDEGTPQGEDKTSKFTRTSRSRDNETLRMVANTQSTRTRANERGIWQRSSGVNGREGTDKDVSDSNSRLRGGWRTEFKSRTNKEWEFYSAKEEQTKEHIRSEAIGHNVISRQDVSNTPSVSSNDRRYGNNSKEKQIQFETRREDSIGNVSDTDGERSQGYQLQQDLEIRQESADNNGKSSVEGQRTWWQAQSRICRIPHGISKTLDKDRSNRIKALGNSIVPQIVRQLGLAILKAEKNDRN